MLCFADSFHLFQGLFVFDVLYYLVVPLEDSEVASLLYTVLNASLLGLAFLEIEFPSATQINNPYGMGAVVLLTGILGAVALYSGIASSAVSVFALITIGGVAIVSFEQYGNMFSGVLTTDPSIQMYILLLLFSGLIALTILLFCLAKAGRFILCSIAYAILALLAIKCVYYQGFMPDPICCDGDACPFTVNTMDVIFLIVLIWLRITAYASYRWHARYKTRYNNLNVSSKENLRHAYETKFNQKRAEETESLIQARTDMIGRDSSSLVLN